MSQVRIRLAGLAEPETQAPLLSAWRRFCELPDDLARAAALQQA